MQRNLEDIMEDVVARVSAKLLPTLQAFDSKITAVHYEHGHPLEIIETLKEKDESKTFKFKRYPLVALFHDFPIRRGQIGIYGEGTLNMAIIRSTKNTYKAKERNLYNFDPVLTPIYDALMAEIGRNGTYFLVENRNNILHTPIKRMYWGRKGLYGNEGNQFNDWVDAIEITDLKLKINNVVCEPRVTGKLNTL